MLSGRVPALNQAAAHRPRASEMPVTEFGARDRFTAQSATRRGSPSSTPGMLMPGLPLASGAPGGPVSSALSVPPPTGHAARPLPSGPSALSPEAAPVIYRTYGYPESADRRPEAAA